MTKPTDIKGAIQKKAKPVLQESLFEDEELTMDWQDYWWDMPSFDMKDARPTKKISVNFLTLADYADFCRRLDVQLSPRTETFWFPPQDRMQGQYYYDGPKVASRYPICIPSKGRADCQRTGRTLDAMGAKYKFFVEAHEYEAYCRAVGERNVVKMPFSDLGQGSIPARNFIWDWAAEHKHKRHWVVDDNIQGFARFNFNRRIICRSGSLFRAIEDFTDRYENIALAGPHERGFVRYLTSTVAPVTWNSRIYSCILVDTSLDYRWRGRYNEDTDLSLRVLKDGYCTALFTALLMSKMATVGTKNARAMKGGNTDNVYNTGDHRRAFAESLQQQHPDVVKVVWKLNRWHHQVDYRPFAKNFPKLRASVTPTRSCNEYGFELKSAEGVALEQYEDEEQQQESEAGGD